MNSTNQLIDVRSDTVTLPNDKMRQAMMTAVVGDDVYGDDPTVNELQSLAADMFGHESALYMPSGTQSNLVALLTHCQRGEEYIVGGEAHTYKYEGGGAAVLGGIQPQTVPFGDNGELPLDQVSQVIKPDDFHFARTRLLCLENTQHGRVQSLDYMQSARDFSKEQNLQLHLDGARVANALVASDVSPKAVGECFDTISVCLSKGLGAPMGSVLIGSTAFIEEARRWRKVTGGGLRQAGVVAATGIIALTDGMERLHEDHEHAQWLANQLDSVDEISVRAGWTQTNMVWLDFDADHQQSLPAFARERGVLMSVGRNAGRVVLHQNIDKQALEKVNAVLKEYFSQ